MIIALLLAAQAVPHPSDVKAFGDWAVACDNGKRCEMTALVPEHASEESKLDAGLSVVREAGPGGGFIVDYGANDEQRGELRIVIDGKPVAQAAARSDSVRFGGATAAAIVTAMANGKALTVTDGAGKLVGAASLAGSSAALRYVDAEQGRVGGVTAVVARGPKPASAVPAPPILPRLVSLAATGRAAPVSKAMLKTLAKRVGCEDDYEPSALESGPWPLAGGKTLVLVPCGAGAYNFSSVPMVLSGGNAFDAPFDLKPTGMGEGDSHPMLVNAEFDPKSGRLTSYAKGRGIGDCGSSEEYAWDGTRFRLAQQTAMGECRQSVNWLTTWRTVTPTKP